MRKLLCALAASSLLLAGGIAPLSEAVNEEAESEPMVVGYFVIEGIQEEAVTVDEITEQWNRKMMRNKKLALHLQKQQMEYEAEQAALAAEMPETVLTDEEIDLIARITMAEAESESELGKRLVIDTVLNRVDHEKFPNDVRSVIFQPGQFHPVGNGRWDRCWARDDIRELVKEECIERKNYDCVYFQRGRDCPWGVWLLKEDHHNFFAYKG